MGKIGEGSWGTWRKQVFPAATALLSFSEELSAPFICFTSPGVWFFRLFTVNWGLTGRCDFPISFSSQEKLEICPLSKLPEDFFRWEINCLAAAAWFCGWVACPSLLSSSILHQCRIRGTGGLACVLVGSQELSTWPVAPGAEGSWPGPAAPQVTLIGVWPSGSVWNIPAGLHFPSLKTSHKNWPGYKTKPQLFL